MTIYKSVVLERNGHDSHNCETKSSSLYFSTNNLPPSGLRFAAILLKSKGAVLSKMYLEYFKIYSTIKALSL